MDYKRSLEKFKTDWRTLVQKQEFPSAKTFSFPKATTHLAALRDAVQYLHSQIATTWALDFPVFVTEKKYKDKKNPFFWKNKVLKAAEEANEELEKGTRHLEVLLGFYETEKSAENTFLEDFANQHEVPVSRLIQQWGKEDFEDSVDLANGIITRRFFRGLNDALKDQAAAFQQSRQRERTVAPLPTNNTEARVAFFCDAGEAEQSLEDLFLNFLPESPYAGKVFAVGGYVRDEALGEEPNDLDIVVEAQYGAQRFAEYLTELFPEAVSEPEPVTLEYPIWRLTFTDDVKYGGELYEVAGAELDLADTQQLEDGSTVFGPISEDANRRDFTVNMLFKDLTTGEVMDPTGLATDDMAQGTLRTLPSQDAARAFQEEPKRMLRLVRFMARYDWEPSEEVEEALLSSLPYLSEIKTKSVLKELNKLKRDGTYKEALQLMKDYGMWEYLNIGGDTRGVEELGNGNGVNV